MATKIHRFLFKNEAVTGVNSPLDYFYAKIVRRSLLLICLWPERELGGNPSKAMVLLKYTFIGSLCTVCMVQQMAYLLKYKDALPFFELGHMYLCMFITMNITVRYFSLAHSSRYRKLVAYFLTKFHVFYYKNQSDYAMKIHKRIHLISHLFTIYVTCQMLGGATLFNLIPMYNNYSSGKYDKNGNTEESTYEYAVYLLYPFNTETDIGGYTASCALGWLLSYLTGVWFCIVDLILSLMIFHIWGHFKILIHTLENFPIPKPASAMDGRVPSNNDMHSESESIMIGNKMKECIDYHRDIVNFTDSISDVFGLTIFAYLCFHQISGCVLLLECSQMTAKALMRYLPLTVIIFQQLIQISVVFELVGSVSDRLSDAVYSLPWQYMNTQNRKTAYILLMNVQTPIHIKALGLADVGVNTMAQILKTSLSYFTFLRTMN